jgi:hypothetical protein
METEQIHRYAVNFLAEMMTIIGRYRGVEGADVLKHFEERIETERSRYQQKFEALLFGEPNHVDAIDATERAVNNIASSEIERARSAGKPEYDALVLEMYANRRALEKLLQQMHGGK